MIAAVSSPEPIGWLAIDAAGTAIHLFATFRMAEQYAVAGGYTLEAVFRGVPAASKAAQDVLTERWRQVAVEGYSYHHDDRHWPGELAMASAAYAIHASMADVGRANSPDAPAVWPWSEDTWKPKTRRADMVRGCALGLAFIERIDRATDREATAAAIAAAQVPA